MSALSRKIIMLAFAVMLALSCIANTAAAQGYPGYYPMPQYPNWGYNIYWHYSGWDTLYNMWGWLNGGWYSNTQGQWGNLQYTNWGYFRPR